MDTGERIGTGYADRLGSFAYVQLHMQGCRFVYNEKSREETKA